MKPEDYRIEEVLEDNVMEAAVVHSLSWQDSHESFCSRAFVEKHTPEHQKSYIMDKICNGSEFFLLRAPDPVGVVSVKGSLIEDLYVIPEMQNRGFGSILLRYAVLKCKGTPTLWILENNANAERLYRKRGFVPTGNVNSIGGRLKEIEFRLGERTVGFELKKAERNEIEDLTRMSKMSFDTDTEVGNSEPGGPPGYDSETWHLEMMERGKLYSFYANGTLVGGAVLFVGPETVYVGKIFIAPEHFRKGYGLALMNEIEGQNPNARLFKLDTPIWNTRTNAFYQKCGYKETSRDDEFVYYRKERT